MYLSNALAPYLAQYLGKPILWFSEQVGCAMYFSNVDGFDTTLATTMSENRIKEFMKLMNDGDTPAVFHHVGNHFQTLVNEHNKFLSKEDLADVTLPLVKYCSQWSKIHRGEQKQLSQNDELGKKLGLKVDKIVQDKSQVNQAPGLDVEALVFANNPQQQTNQRQGVSNALSNKIGQSLSINNAQQEIKIDKATQDLINNMSPEALRDQQQEYQKYEAAQQQEYQKYEAAQQQKTLQQNSLDSISAKWYENITNALNVSNLTQQQTDTLNGAVVEYLDRLETYKKELEEKQQPKDAEEEFDRKAKSFLEEFNKSVTSYASNNVKMPQQPYQQQPYNQKMTNQKMTQLSALKKETIASVNSSPLTKEQKDLLLKNLPAQLTAYYKEATNDTMTIETFEGHIKSSNNVFKSQMMSDALQNLQNEIGDSLNSSLLTPEQKEVYKSQVKESVVMKKYGETFMQVKQGTAPITTFFHQLKTFESNIKGSIMTAVAKTLETEVYTSLELSSLTPEQKETYKSQAKVFKVMQKLIGTYAQVTKGTASMETFFEQLQTIRDNVTSEIDECISNQLNSTIENVDIAVTNKQIADAEQIEADEKYARQLSQEESKKAPNSLKTKGDILKSLEMEYNNQFKGVEELFQSKKLRTIKQRRTLFRR